ncbi:MAG: sulfite exporter TauE/SafE family protein [Deltaproteobacteria bacterium]|nr:sulfite exporter TauE/SafE family protein [Deltaproteobacteria bacterium]
MSLELLAPFLIGLFGSLHCLGMCGSLILAYSLHIKSPEVRAVSAGRPPWIKGLFHHLAYHSGRLLTYGLLGALAAGLVNVSGFNLHLPVRGGIILAGGILILLLGAVFLGAVPLPGWWSRFSLTPCSVWDRFLPPLLLRPGSLSKAALGLASGLLPCCLSCSMLIKAAVTENMAAGCLTMVAFGLGTVPALLGLGISASLFTLRTRRIGEGLAALAIMVLGLILIFRGAKLLV